MSDTTIDTRPILELVRNDPDGPLHIGVVELDERGFGVRAYVLVQQGTVADSVMERRYEDMKRLMGANVQTR